MKISDKRYEAIEKAYAECAKAVCWAYDHWDLDTDIESALAGAMGDGVAKSLVGLLHAVEGLLENGKGLPGPVLVLRSGDLDPDR